MGLYGGTQGCKGSELWVWGSGVLGAEKEMKEGMANQGYGIDRVWGSLASCL